MIYVASSWRNPIYPAVVDTLRRAGHELYDFRNPPGGEGFHWSQVGGTPGSRSESIERYQEMLAHPRAEEGFANDMNHLATADTVVLLLPCGKSAHLELGFAVGAGKRTAILLENPVEPDLMYKMVDYLAPSLGELLSWLAMPERPCAAVAPHRSHPWTLLGGRHSWCSGRQAYPDRVVVHGEGGEMVEYAPVAGPRVIGGRYTPGAPHVRGRRAFEGGGQNSGA